MARPARPEAPRDVVVRRVMRNLARRTVNHGPLPVQAADGTYPIVVVLPDDSVGDMEARRSRVGRDANVIVAYPDRMVLIAMRDAVREDAAEIHPDSPMDMLVIFLRAHPDETPAIRVGTEASRRIEDLAYAF